MSPQLGMAISVDCLSKEVAQQSFLFIVDLLQRIKGYWSGMAPFVDDLLDKGKGE
jgi:hypothetical protein